MDGADRRAFVAGATGYVGRAAVQALVARGVAVTAHVRPDSRRAPEWRERFGALGAAVDESPWAREALAATLARTAPDLLFCLIGTTRARGKALARAGGDRREVSYERVDYGLTQLLLDACATAGVRPRFVYLSAIGAGPRARGAYMAARWRAEEAVRASGLPYVIARPGLITGPDREERRTAELAAACVLDGALGIAERLGLRRLARRWGSVSGPALAAALVDRTLAALTDGAPLDLVLESEELKP